MTDLPHRWDIFCRVIDNFGDIGVSWRLANDIASRGHQVRLWLDDASALHWMAPQGHAGVEVLDWKTPIPTAMRAALKTPAVNDKSANDDGLGVLIETFGGDIPPQFLEHIGAHLAAGRPAPLWINLEYLSAEAYAERSHRLPSPLFSGPAAGCTRWFFYPGFTERSGGLLRERDLKERQTTFMAHGRAAWRAAHGVAPDALAISLFCYEPPALPELLAQWNDQPDETGQAAPSAVSPVHWLVTPGRASAAMRAALADDSSSAIFENLSQNSPQRPPSLCKSLTFSYLDAVPQPQFDEMLWAADLNLVRGEDSLVRALWAGQPMVWHIYPQEDQAHHTKLDAYLDWLKAPASLRQFHHVWNGVIDAPLPTLDHATLQEWAQCQAAARDGLWLQQDLVGQLFRLCAEKR